MYSKLPMNQRHFEREIIVIIIYIYILYREYN
jgi:hypothetical protein